MPSKSSQSSIIVESVVPLTEEQLRRIRMELPKSLAGNDTSITCKVNPQLIGGLKIHVADTTIDMSLKTRLEQLHATLRNS